MKFILPLPICEASPAGAETCSTQIDYEFPAGALRSTIYVLDSGFSPPGWGRSGHRAGKFMTKGIAFAHWCAGQRFDCLNWKTVGLFSKIHRPEGLSPTCLR
jgi:hypothetical protein